MFKNEMMKRRGIIIKKLLIIGSGGHGRCCLDIARDMNIYDQIAFLDEQSCS